MTQANPQTSSETFLRRGVTPEKAISVSRHNLASHQDQYIY
ncbi:MAG: hypothetical protein QNJ55_29710 [Xenococcus sp. MO_188.B8]|nr:hypothetical protein [Xenococcus sp. MO_188.B8]